MRVKEAVNILIVEDELLIAEYISSVLAKNSYLDVRIAGTYEKALSEIEERKPDLVLSDINLGSTENGIDLGRILRTNYQIPFIYITSHSSIEMVRQAGKTNPDAFLVKPFRNEDLMVALELSLSASESRKTEDDQCLFIKDGHTLARIPHDEILILKAEKNYTVIQSNTNRSRLVRFGITDLHGMLPNADFLRVHKSFVVNRKYITELKSDKVFLSRIELPVGRAFRTDLMEKIRPGK